MNTLDVEALLDATASSSPNQKLTDKQASHRRRGRESSRDRKGDGGKISDSGNEKSSREGRVRGRSRSPGRDRGKDRHERRRTPVRKGDHYRGTGRSDTRSSGEANHYRPSRYSGDSYNPRRDNHRGGNRYNEGRQYDDRRDGNRGGQKYSDSRHSRGQNSRDKSESHDKKRGSKSRSLTPPVNADDRDRRTVFVQQLAARLRSSQLEDFFVKHVGGVESAQIVVDRLSSRSKGVGYVEFKNIESVAKAMELTGQKLLGIPIIVQPTEAEKNRQQRNPESNQQNPDIPYWTLWLGNVHFSMTVSDLTEMFEPFGPVTDIKIMKGEDGRSRGHATVLFAEPDAAKAALETMDGFEVAGRAMRIGLGGEKNTPATSANHLARWAQFDQQYKTHQRAAAASGSGIYGSGGRGKASFGRSGGRDTEKGNGAASALNGDADEDVNYGSFDRNALMRKLARTEEEPAAQQKAAAPRAVAIPVNVPKASRCVVLKNM